MFKPGDTGRTRKEQFPGVVLEVFPDGPFVAAVRKPNGWHIMHYWQGGHRFHGKTNPLDLLPPTETERNRHD